MLFGSHISIAGGISLVPEKARAVGCDVLQIFSRSPRGGSAPPITKSIIDEYKKNIKKFNIHASYIHAPYIINLASKNARIRWGSISLLKEELSRGSKLGIEFVITHLGSGKDFGKKISIQKITQSIHNILDGYDSSTMLILEQSAGAGGDEGIMGGTLEELAQIYRNVTQLNPAYKKKLGFCIDTCHAFAMGYDIRTQSTVHHFVKRIDSTIGLKTLKLWHFNDSVFDFESHKDRHEHIGKGKIGKAGFTAIINHPKLKHLNAILETPKDALGKFDKMNLKRLQSLQK